MGISLGPHFLGRKCSFLLIGHLGIMRRRPRKTKDQNRLPCFHTKTCRRLRSSFPCCNSRRARRRRRRVVLARVAQGTVFTSINPPTCFSPHRIQYLSKFIIAFDSSQSRHLSSPFDRRGWKSSPRLGSVRSRRSISRNNIGRNGHPVCTRQPPPFPLSLPLSFQLVFSHTVVDRCE